MLARATVRIAALAVSAFGQPAVTQDPGGIPADREIVTTESGLKYSVLREGLGTRRPRPGESVRVHYTGWLTDGRQFDSSRDRGEPGKFEVDGVIPGWSEALQLMTEGARFKLTIPSELAYGSAGSPPEIGPDTDLVFDLELTALEPRFPPGDSESTVETDTGVSYEVLREGKGERPGPDDIFELDYTVFSPAGRILDTSFDHLRTIKGKAEHMKLPFLAEIAPRMRTGGVWRVEVGREQSFVEGMPPGFEQYAPDGRTVWELRLSRVVEALPVPEFALPSAEELVTTTQGLQYEVVRKGEGDPPQPWQVVTVHFAGWLPDGTLIDSSYPRGEPLVARSSSLLLGWQFMLAKMSPGAVCRAKIPAQLAFGKQGGAAGVVGPDQDLVYHIELIEVRGRPPGQRRED